MQTYQVNMSLKTAKEIGEFLGSPTYLKLLGSEDTCQRIFVNDKTVIDRYYTETTIMELQYKIAKVKSLAINGIGGEIEPRFVCVKVMLYNKM